MGLPEIIIEFKTKGVTAIKRSARGIVAIVLKDDTEEGQALNIYKSVLDVDPTHFTARNYEYLKLVYEGSPRQDHRAEGGHHGREPEPAAEAAERPEVELPGYSGNHR